jgi:hypothetical protein
MKLIINREVSGGYCKTAVSRRAFLINFKTMAKLNLKDVKIELPKEFNGNPDDVDIVEWLEYKFGARSDIRIANPLCNLELSDCNISVGEAKIDGKPFVF